LRFLILFCLAFSLLFAKHLFIRTSHVVIYNNLYSVADNITETDITVLSSCVRGIVVLGVACAVAFGLFVQLVGWIKI
jgi:hypothetical protein